MTTATFGGWCISERWGGGGKSSESLGGGGKKSGEESTCGGWEGGGGGGGEGNSVGWWPACSPWSASGRLAKFSFPGLGRGAGTPDGSLVSELERDEELEEVLV